MDIVVRILVLIIGLLAGVACMRYNYQLTRLFGYNDYAERFLGDAGTYSMWRILGVVIILGSLYYTFH